MIVTGCLGCVLLSSNLSMSMEYEGDLFRSKWAGDQMDCMDGSWDECGWEVGYNDHEGDDVAQRPSRKDMTVHTKCGLVVKIHRKEKHQNPRYPWFESVVVSVYAGLMRMKRRGEDHGGEMTLRARFVGIMRSASESSRIWLDIIHISSTFMSLCLQKRYIGPRCGGFRRPISYHKSPKLVCSLQFKVIYHQITVRVQFCLLQYCNLVLPQGEGLIAYIASRGILLQPYNLYSVRMCLRISTTIFCYPDQCFIIRMGP